MLVPFSSKLTKMQMEDTTSANEFVTPQHGLYQNPLETSASYQYREPEARDYVGRKSQSRSPSKRSGMNQKQFYSMNQSYNTQQFMQETPHGGCHSCNPTAHCSHCVTPLGVHGPTLNPMDSGLAYNQVQLMNSQRLSNTQMMGVNTTASFKHQPQNVSFAGI